MIRALLVATLWACLTVSSPAVADAPVDAAGIPTATTAYDAPEVGGLFFGSLADGHGCTASVVRSPGRDLLVTAAHCISGTGRGIRFVPGYRNGATPYGIWDVIGAWVDPAWTAHQDPQHDVAFLRVADQRRGGRTVGVQDVVGGSLLGFAPRAGRTITVPAYPGGVDDQPITCTAPVYDTDGYPGFDCHGYVGGTSGSPFLRTLGRLRLVTGVIGGLHQGGCVESTSYSSAFGPDTLRTYLRAVRGARADTVPPAGSDGC